MSMALISRSDQFVRRIEAAAEHALPEVLDAHRVLADEPFLEMLDGADDGLPAALKTGFAEADEAFVGFDEHGNEGATGGLDGNNLDVGDFHLSFPLPPGEGKRRRQPTRG
jgi:hypothetical protein